MLINELNVDGRKIKSYKLKHFDTYSKEELSAIISALPSVGSESYDYAVDKLFMELPDQAHTRWRDRWEYSIKPTRFFLDRNPEVPGDWLSRS